MSTLVPVNDCLITIGIFGDNYYSGEEFFSSEFQDDSKKSRFSNFLSFFRTKEKNKYYEDSLLAKKLIDVDNIKFYVKFYQHISARNNRFFFCSKIFIICINPFDNNDSIDYYLNQLNRYYDSDYCYCFFLAKTERDTKKSPIKKDGKSATDYYSKMVSAEGENIDCFINYINIINEKYSMKNNESYLGTYLFFKYDKCTFDKALKNIYLKYYNKINKQNIL